MKHWLLLIAPLLLAGCAHRLGGDGGAPEVETPAHWRTQVGPQGPLAPGWWDRFGDPVLAGYVQAALAHNLDVATAAARVREARAQEALARSQLFPSLDFAYNESRARSLNALGKPSVTTTRQPGFQAAYEVDLWGKIADQAQAAHAGTQASEFGRDAAALSVAAATASGYITLRALDARLRILRDTVADRATAAKLAQRRMEVGYTSDLEWRQAQAEYESAAQQVPAAQLAIERQEHGLALLTGRAPHDIARGLSLASLKTPAVPDGLPSQLLRRRPDIAQAERTLAASDATLASTRAQFLPTVRLTASLGELFVSGLPASPVTVWSIGSSVLAPIFNGGRIQANVDTASARREQAAFAYQRTVLTAFREVEDNLLAVLRSREQRARLEAQRAVLADVLRHASHRYEAGYSSYLEQLDAQRGVLTAELALVQSRADELAAIVALSQAMGGGWEAP